MCIIDFDRCLEKILRNHFKGNFVLYQGLRKLISKSVIMVLSVLLVFYTTTEKVKTGLTRPSR